MGPSSSVQNFFGVKISQVGVPVNNANDSQLTYKLDYNTGVQTFYGSNGSTINFGPNPDGTLGLNVQNNNQQVLFELSGETWIWYDQSGNDIMQVGILPNGLAGWAVATPGNSVTESFS